MNEKRTQNLERDVLFRRIASRCRPERFGLPQISLAIQHEYGQLPCACRQTGSDRDEEMVSKKGKYFAIIFV